MPRDASFSDKLTSLIGVVFPVCEPLAEGVSLTEDINKLGPKFESQFTLSRATQQYRY